MKEYVKCGDEILIRHVDWGIVSYYNYNLIRHRLDGPAIEHRNGAYIWFLHGEKHHVGGPAVYKNECSQQWHIYGKEITDPLIKIKLLQRTNHLLKLTILQNKSRKFNEWLFDPDHYAGKWHKTNMLRDFQDS